MGFTKKYHPLKKSDIIGQKEGLIELEKKLKERLTSSKNKKTRKAIFLYGPTGIGKTSSIHVLAEELGLELIEVNASDTDRKSTRLNSSH